MRSTVFSLFHESQAPCARTTTTIAASVAMTDLSSRLTDSRLNTSVSEHDEGTKASVPGVRSGRPHHLHELLDLGLQATALACERLRGAEHLRRGGAGFTGTAVDVGDV